ncbi:MAG: ABC transporter ATP-binding protein [Lysobacterales bacterium]
MTEDYTYTPWLDPDAKPLVEIRSVSKSFGDLTAVDNVDLDIYAGELFTILGASGSGKTTLLRMLAGFEEPSAGVIRIDGVDMSGVPPYARPVNIMFQSYALFPHMSVVDNVAYGLKKQGVKTPSAKRRALEMLKLVKLERMGDRKPQQLSGGERQRVALARALIKQPKLLLLDEPLAALDKKLREHTQFELMNIQDELGVTFVVVTHDQEEAMTLSSRIVVMNQGRFEQVGTPAEIYEYPANHFVADFVGNINLLEATVTGTDGDRVSVDCPALGLPVETMNDGGFAVSEKLWLAVRPEKIFISKARPQQSGMAVVSGKVREFGYFGNLSVFRVELASGAILQVSGQNRERRASHSVEWDDQVYVSWHLGSAILLNGRAAVSDGAGG